MGYSPWGHTELDMTEQPILSSLLTFQLGLYLSITYHL